MAEQVWEIRGAYYCKGYEYLDCEQILGPLNAGEAAKVELERLRAEIAALKAAPPVGLVEELRAYVRSQHPSNITANEVAGIIARHLQEKPVVEWTSRKGSHGNTEWYCNGDLALRPQWRDDGVVWCTSGFAGPFADLDEAKAAIEARLTPPTPPMVRRWVSRDKNKGLCEIWDQKPDYEDGIFAGHPGCLSIGANCFTALTGITVGEGQCVEVEFMLGFCRVVVSRGG